MLKLPGIVILLPFLLWAQPTAWVTAEGSASMVDKTLQQARVEALNQARAEAVRVVAGARIKSEQFRLQTETSENEHLTGIQDFFSSINRDVACGHVISEKILHEGMKDYPTSPGKPPAVYYEVKIEAGVAIEQGEPDPTFTLQVRTNKEIYLEFEEMSLDIRASHTCYLYVFNILANDSLLLLYPNRYLPENRLPANQNLHLMPSGLSFQVSLLPGARSAQEFIYVVATKKLSPFSPGDQGDADIFRTAETHSFAIIELPRWLSQIPVDQRADEIVAYQIHQKRK